MAWLSLRPLAATEKRDVLEEVKVVLRNDDELSLRDAIVKALGRKDWMETGLGSEREKSLTASVAWANGAKGSIPDIEKWAKGVSRDELLEGIDKTIGYLMKP